MEIKYRDGSTNCFSIYKSKKESLKITFLILPALGVRASYYHQFADELSRSGYDVVTIDWRGHGKSSVRPSRNSDFGYEQLVRDLKENSEVIKILYPQNEIIFIGHSLGGQIASLFSARFPGYCSRIVLVASGSIYYRAWNGVERIKVILAAKLFYPISKILGYFPGEKVGFGSKEAMTLMKDWGKNVFSGEYVLTDSDFNYEKALMELKSYVLSITIENDYLVNTKSAENLISKFHKTSEVVRVHLNDKHSNGVVADHFTWAKTPEYVINKIENWLKNSF